MSTIAYDSFADFVLWGPYASFVREHRSAGSAPVRMLAMAQPPGDYPDAPTPDLVAGMVVGGSGRAVGRTGGPRWTRWYRPGDIALTPAGCATEFTHEGATELLQVAVPWISVRAVLDCDTSGLGDFGRLHDRPFRDPLVEHICRGMWREAEAASSLSLLFADSALRLLALSLLKASGEARPPEPARGGLGPARLRRAVDFIEARLGEDLSLGEIAEAAGLSPWHFARAFRQELGATPFAFVRERRVERAKELLAEGSLPLAEVAFEVGFKSQEHFTAVFRRHVGTTPGRWRAARS